MDDRKIMTKEKARQEETGIQYSRGERVRFRLKNAKESWRQQWEQGIVEKANHERPMGIVPPYDKMMAMHITIVTDFARKVGIPFAELIRLDDYEVEKVN